MGQNRKSQSPKLDATYPKISGATYPKISDWKPSFVGLSKYAIFGRYPLPQTHLKGFSEKKTSRNDFKVPIPGLFGKGQSIQMGYLKNWKPIPSPLGTNSVHRELRYGPAILGGATSQSFETNPGMCQSGQPLNRKWMVYWIQQKDQGWRILTCIQMGLPENWNIVAKFMGFLLKDGAKHFLCISHVETKTDCYSHWIVKVVG